MMQLRTCGRCRGKTQRSIRSTHRASSPCWMASDTALRSASRSSSSPVSSAREPASCAAASTPARPPPMSRAWRRRDHCVRCDALPTRRTRRRKRRRRSCLFSGALRRRTAGLEVGALHLGRAVCLALARRRVVAAAPRREAVAVDGAARFAGSCSARGRGAVHVAHAREREAQAAEREHDAKQSRSASQRERHTQQCQLSSFPARSPPSKLSSPAPCRLPRR